MKGDFSRSTFDREKPYSAVLMQQGRVQLDAEWNEQQEIHQHRAETGTGDMVGPSGAPVDEGGMAGFEITAEGGRLYIGEGHVFVDGILCVNEEKVLYDEDETGQPYPPAPVEKLTQELSGWTEDQDVRLGLVYLDVWERHVTHLDDGRIREVALGGPDTTTRKQTVWQVKILELKDLPEGDRTLLKKYAELRDNSSPSPAEKKDLNEISPKAIKILEGLCGKSLDDLRTPPNGTLNVELKQTEDAAGRCQIPPGGGYERLENQLYRVEVHRSGNLGTARFKWSRDNGSVVTGITQVDGKEITVQDTGRDEYLGFAVDQWVEVVDDLTELHASTNEQPPRLLRIADDVDEDERIVTVEQTPPSIDRKLHPKLRRWDQSGEDAEETGVKLRDGRLKLEGGIEAVFSSGHYRAGDYWLIPARTATGDVEWPRTGPDDPPSTPIPQPPHGVRHGFCALAVVMAIPDRSPGEQLTRLHDCRRLFPRLTNLRSFFYLGGDGQEAMPGGELLEPLRVGVANGRWPVRGARVRFDTDNGTLTTEDETLSSSADGVLTVLTDARGVAACQWKLDDQDQGQRVTATLLDTEDETTHLPVYFHANMSVASEVFYESGDCANLREIDNVQEAIDKISTLKSLYYLNGDGQHVPPDEVDGLDPLEVLVANDCGPVKDARVEFTVVQGNGTLSDPNVTTDEHGVASCKWKLDDQTLVQRVKAELDDEARDDTRGPTSFVFTATLNRGQARHTSYDPERCAHLGEAGSVQDAIDALCRNSTLHYVGGDGQEAMPGAELPRPLQVRVANGRWPVEEARVRFQTRTGTLQNVDITFETTTGPDGVAESSWRLGSDPEESQEVEAYLLDRDGEPVEPPVRFGANLSVASRVAYDPANCELLAETRTVQEAIDRLCRGGGGQDPEPGFHVEEVRRLIDDEPVRYGSRMPLRELLAGLRIVCDHEVEPETINRATCFVTLDLPWQLSGEERMFPNMLDMISGFQPIVIRSDPKSEGKEIRWHPSVDERFGDVLFGIPIDEPTLARLVLKGNFIHAQGEPDLYLDGDAFFDPRDEFGLRRPTGDGRRGGDFELYIWVDLPWIG